MLECRGLVKRFGSVCAIHDVTVEFCRAGVYALLGPNGSGKTTLFNVVCGLVRTDAGEVLLNGRKITSLPVFSRIRLGIGRTFQQPRVVGELTVEENVLLGLRRPLLRGAVGTSTRVCVSRKEGAVVREVLERLSLDDERATYASSLSYGQRKLLELARLLARAPSVALVDEPTAGLAVGARRRVIEELVRLGRTGSVVVFTEHDMEVVEAAAGAVVVMEEGRVIARGGTEILQSETVKRAYYGLR